MPVADGRLIEVFLTPEQYDSVPTEELLHAAAHGHIGIDHRFLRAILDQRSKALPVLVRFAAEDHGNDPVNLEEDLIALFRCFNTPDALPFYIRLIREDPEHVSDEIIDCVSALGEPAIEPLLALYEELGEENAGDVAFLLAVPRVHDPRVLKTLTERLDFDLSDAALCLEILGDPAAIPALEGALEQVPDDEAHPRQEVEAAIESLTQAKAPAALDPPEPFDIWGLYPETAPPAFEILTEAERLAMLVSPSAERRAQAAASFVNSALPDAAQAKLLALARNDLDANVRGRAWEALGDVADSPEVRKSMLAVVEDSARPVEERGGAVVGLSQQVDNPRVRKAVEAMYAEPGGRAKALEAMWRSFDRTFGEYPPRHLEDPDSEVRRHAIWGVGQLGLASEAGRLKPFFEEEELRPDALFNYALSTPTDVSRSRMRSLLTKIDEIAGGLTTGETELVEMALDQRLLLQGMKPVFSTDPGEEANDGPAVKSSEPGRNDPCPCGSGKKFKKCHGA